MQDSSLYEKVKAGHFVTAPGIQDMITAVIARRVGFDAVYGSGYWLTASALGLPDAGIASVTQMTDRMARLVESAQTPVIADADTGFGGLLNVHHTVRAYENAGVAAIQLEDQEFPKKCGHTPFKRVIPAEQMVEKIKVACDARRDERLLVIARTDVMQSEGYNAVEDRMGAFAEAGADILFPEALTSVEQMRQICAAIDRPMLANMANGGITPILDTKTLAEIGFRLAIFPSMTSLAAARAVELALLALKQDGDSLAGPEQFDFKAFCGLIGFEDVWAFERKWASAGEAAMAEG
ncbi:isocitrate lyase/PEP mutase family protein [Novosphingobium sp. KCTC 2891]|uniref:isocitrate lyase/PEP mutase family protein n=1 Tax=Novosphingobium sp. KCTC 2891 TaxID=2989730 RepID=UPI00222316B2|nr:isocitrate lyase/PEP mutase family protein [Novosphingobium sp. KCTC 2891]MCW1383811.1 isocitrate lyase/PEP mutase family protein [Novosphingobium sp. KCTC 2891]